MCLKVSFWLRINSSQENENWKFSKNQLLMN
ncbi:hypothetical protein HCH_05188 [Hahella chejuensis KCTC 2396]|uniref:Uncharacterized protein n=1 Tax=Hahella chejuensis (strain KCTC 2396) TaxID=349521 RepID=Q2SBV8_HAHCH|nr:hypothetical protein HCH_05188 [Hahella chejuensis KCTC 2396]